MVVVRLELVLPLATNVLGSACKAGMVVAPSAGVLTPCRAQSNLRAVRPDVLSLVSVVREGGPILPGGNSSVPWYSMGWTCGGLRTLGLDQLGEG